MFYGCQDANWFWTLPLNVATVHASGFYYYLALTKQSQ